MLTWSRDVKIRVLVTTIMLAGLNLLPGDYAQLAVIRGNLEGSLPFVTLLFGLTAGLAVTLITRLVFGLTERAHDHIRRTRKLLSDLEAYLDDMDAPGLDQLYDRHVAPLRLLSTANLNLSAIPKWSDGIETTLKGIEQPTRSHILAQYLLPLEEEVNGLGYVLLRRITGTVLRRLVGGVFRLIGLSALVIVLVALLPQGPSWDLIAVNLMGAVILLAGLEFVLVLSYLDQEAEYESPDLVSKGASLWWDTI